MRWYSYVIPAVILSIIAISGVWWNATLGTRLDQKVQLFLNEHSSILNAVYETTTIVYTEPLHTSVSETITSTSFVTETTTVTPTVTATAQELSTLNPHPENSKIVLLMGSNAQNDPSSPLNPYIRTIIKNRRDYAERHGFKFEFLDLDEYKPSIGDKPAPWAKIPMIKNVIRKYPDAEWVWWLDHDALIMNRDLNLVDHILKHEKLNSLLLRDTEYFSGFGIDSEGFRTPKNQDPDDIHFIIAQDFNGINAGSFLIRNSEVGTWMLDFWNEPLYKEHNGVFVEQQALSHMIYSHPIVHKHVGLVTLRAINAYDSSDPAWGYEDGDLCVHFAGCFVFQTCAQNFEKYGKIITEKQGHDWFDPSEKEYIEQRLFPQP